MNGVSTKPGEDSALKRAGGLGRWPPHEASESLMELATLRKMVVATIALLLI